MNHFECHISFDADEDETGEAFRLVSNYAKKFERYRNHYYNLKVRRDDGSEENTDDGIKKDDQDGMTGVVCV